jgi:hypothetical protein
MDYQAFTNGSHSLMYEAVRGALSSDDAQERQREDSQRIERTSNEDRGRSAAMLECLKRHNGQLLQAY